MPNSPIDSIVRSENTQLFELDRDIALILNNTGLNLAEKHFHYYNTITRHLYNLDPRFKPDKFAFEIHSDPTCQDKQTARIVKKKRQHQRLKRLRKTLCALVAPSIGATIAVFLRRCIPV